jgi:hypothetical protein
MNSIELVVKRFLWPEAVTQACNPSYSGGRDQEDHNLRPA